MCGKFVEENTGVLPDIFSLVSCDSQDIIIETVKCSEQGEDIIVFDTLENVLLRTYMGLIIPDYQSLDGTVYSYKVKSTGKVLEITVIEK